MGVDSNRYFSKRLTMANVDCFVHQTGIVAALRRVIPQLRGRLLDVGCGNQPYREFLHTHAPDITEYVGLDIDGGRYEQPNVRWDGKTMPFHGGEFHCALLTEVLEHCPEPNQTLLELHRVLSPGAYVLATVPFIWPLHYIPHDEYRYTPFALRRLFDDSGFVDVEITAFGGWDAALAQMLGLWLRRRPMPKWKRSILGRCMRPLLSRLIKHDVAPKQFFESYMISGCSILARKPSREATNDTPLGSDEAGRLE